MKKFSLRDLKMPFKRNGKLAKEGVKSLENKSNVNEEYKEAFRTNSYIEICNKIHAQLDRKGCYDNQLSSSMSMSSSSSSSSKKVNLTGFLHESRQETLSHIPENSELHQLLIDYFDISLQACRLCELLLKNILKVRYNYRLIKTAMNQMKKVPNGASWDKDDQCHAVYRTLSSFSILSNPLSTITPLQFNELQESRVNLLHRLTSKCRKTKRRKKLISCFKKAMRYILIGVIGGIFVIPSLILAVIHSTIAALTGPVFFILGSLSLLFKKLKVDKKDERLGIEELDIAAKGVYILIKDFDTISSLVKRLHDEFEHEKFVADMFVRKGKNEIMKEVLREFQIHGSCFLEQLDELEKQIYLCFLHINRSRRLLFEEMVIPSIHSQATCLSLLVFWISKSADFDQERRSYNSARDLDYISCIKQGLVQKYNQRAPVHKCFISTTSFLDLPF